MLSFAAAPVATPPVDQRAKILEAALGLLADYGAAGMSMRRLAAACDMNVATLYHYYPSKAELVRSAIEHGALGGLDATPRLESTEGSAQERLAALLRGLAAEMFANGDLWRVLIAEALRGDDHVLATVLAVSDAFDAALARWIRDLLPDVPALSEPATVTALRHGLYGMLLLALVQPHEREAVLPQQTEQLADLFVRSAQAPIARTDAAGPDPTGPDRPLHGGSER